MLPLNNLVVKLKSQIMAQAFLFIEKVLGNHGYMHHEQNYVRLRGVASDVPPTTLTLPYNTSASTSLPIADSTNFATFENVAVGATNPGLVKIGDEVIKYTGTSSGQLTGITRGALGEKDDYVKGTPVHKYEIAGVSLARINRDHMMDKVTDRDPNPITFDSYTLKIPQDAFPWYVNSFGHENRSTGASFPKLYANETKSAGGYKIKGSQNIPFQIISPTIHNVTVPGTTINATMRTVSGSNLNDGKGQGADLPFQDKGYETVTLNKTNFLNSPRMIASRVNETSQSALANYPGDRSFGMTINLETADTHLTPIIDLQRMSAVLVSNRIDSPVANYKTDPRVNTIDEDPHAMQYVSKENTLINSATSIKIMFDAHINEYADVRCFYAVSDQSNFDPIFIPFPGYKNLNDKGEMIELSDSDGRSDTFVPQTDARGFSPSELSYKEYAFTANNLPAFKAYRIKFVLSSTNQTFCPRVSSLRVITLA